MNKEQIQLIEKNEKKLMVNWKKYYKKERKR